MSLASGTEDKTYLTLSAYCEQLGERVTIRIPKDQALLLCKELLAEAIPHSLGALVQIRVRTELAQAREVIDGLAGDVARLKEKASSAPARSRGGLTDEERADVMLEAHREAARMKSLNARKRIIEGLKTVKIDWLPDSFKSALISILEKEGIAELCQRWKIGNATIKNLAFGIPLSHGRVRSRILTAIAKEMEGAK